MIARPARSCLERGAAGRFAIPDLGLQIDIIK